MKLVPSKIPGVDTRASTSLWNTLISPDMLRQMKLNPGETFQLANDNGDPYVATRPIAATLNRSCPKPYRVQTRAAGESKNQRHVWISFDPGHWEHTRNTRKNAAKHEGARR